MRNSSETKKLPRPSGYEVSINEPYGDTPNAAKGRRAKLRKNLVPIIILIAIPAALLVGWLYDSSMCPSVVLVPKGIVLTLQPGQFMGYNFTLTKEATPSGRAMDATLSADNGVVMFIMTPSEFSGYNTNEVGGSYVWTSGRVSSVSWWVGCKYCSPNDPQIGLGSYYFVLSNPGTSLTTKITVSSQIDMNDC